MDYEKKIDIPFGAFDSELVYQEINIPDGFEATIEGNKIIFKKVESEDDKIKKSLIILLRHFCKGYRVPGLEFPVSYKDMLNWVENQGKQKTTGWAEENERIRKAIICGMNALKDQKKETFAAIPIDDCIAWLEKQCKQKPVDKVEPKFKPGDKLVSTKNPRLTYKILNVGNINKLGNLEYEIEIFIDEKPGIQVGGSFKEHNIHLMECVKVDKWAKLIDEVKPKWTEEDKSKVEDIIYFLNTAKTHYASTSAIDDCVEWLESLKRRIEEQQ